eukprot:SAG31_NODE_4179_length_3499_cov_5.939412_2_plen_473_part_00
MDSDIKINLATVSRKHAEIYRDLVTEKVWLCNVNPNNETRLNGQPVKAQQEVTDGGMIEIHGRFFRFEHGAPPPGSGCAHHGIVLPSGVTALSANVREGWMHATVQCSQERPHGEIVSGLQNVNAAKQGGFTPLYVAAEKGHSEIVSGLVAAGADVNAAAQDGFTPLYVAAEKGHREIVSGLVAAGADVNAAAQDGATPLVIAAFKGHSEIVSGLVAAGADVNAVNQKNGFITPLHFASLEGHSEIVSGLVAAGAEVNAAAHNGVTPLFIAAEKGHREIVSGLVAAGADVNAAAQDGATPLVIAAFKGHSEIVSGLVAAGADVNATRQDGVTPLYVAATKGSVDVVLSLLVGGSSSLGAGKVRWLPVNIRSLLCAPPTAAPLVATHVRLAWSSVLHERLGRGCECFLNYDVVARVAGFVRAAVYRVQLQQAQLFYEFRANTLVDSDDAARLCLSGAGWDVTIATRSFWSSRK